MFMFWVVLKSPLSLDAYKKQQFCLPSNTSKQHYRKQSRKKQIHEVIYVNEYILPFTLPSMFRKISDDNTHICINWIKNKTIYKFMSSNYIILRKNESQVNVFDFHYNLCRNI